ncbi:hypothetical protein G6F59_014978 [Rhizopus arrhizus]|nr:hypothetical protein G6F59_014978 [Rhizopus arrhizus]
MRAPQRRQVGVTAQHAPDVLGQCPDVCAFTASHIDLCLRPRQGQQLDAVNRDLARRAFQLDAGARVLVQRLAVALERGVHRRNLLDRARET